MARDADDQRRKQQRRDDGGDEAQEDLAEDAQLDGHAWEVVADLGADHHRHQDPGRQGTAARDEDDERDDGEPAENHPEVHG